MRALNRLALAALASVAALGAAQAADPISYPLSTDVAMPVYDSPGYDWSGFYAGVFGAAQTSAANGTQFGGGVALGVNAQFDFVLVGAEVAVLGITGPADNIYVQGTGRAGVLVTDELAIFAAAGYGVNPVTPVENHVLVGGGLEYAVTDNVSLRAQYLHGIPITGGTATDQVTLGANFSF